MVARTGVHKLTLAKGTHTGMKHRNLPEHEHEEGLPQRCITTFPHSQVHVCAYIIHLEHNKPKTIQNCCGLSPIFVDSCYAVCLLTYRGCWWDNDLILNTSSLLSKSLQFSVTFFSPVTL